MVMKRPAVSMVRRGSMPIRATAWGMQRGRAAAPLPRCVVLPHTSCALLGGLPFRLLGSFRASGPSSRFCCPVALPFLFFLLFSPSVGPFGMRTAPPFPAGLIDDRQWFRRPVSAPAGGSAVGPGWADAARPRRVSWSASCAPRSGPLSGCRRRRAPSLARPCG